MMTMDGLRRSFRRSYATRTIFKSKLHWTVSLLLLLSLPRCSSKLALGRTHFLSDPKEQQQQEHGGTRGGSSNSNKNEKGSTTTEFQPMLGRTYLLSNAKEQHDEDQKGEYGDGADSVVSSSKSVPLQQEGSSSSSVRQEICTGLDDVVNVWVEYVLLSVQAIPQLITEEGLENIGTAFVQAYNSIVPCPTSESAITIDGSGGAFRKMDFATILPNAVDAFGDDYGLDLGIQEDDQTNIVTEQEGLILRNFTYLMVTRGRCNVCGRGTSVLICQ